VYRYPWYTV